MLQSCKKNLKTRFLTYTVEICVGSYMAENEKRIRTNSIRIRYESERKTAIRYDPIRVKVLSDTTRSYPKKYQLSKSCAVV